ncbi:aldo-keto reductase 1B-like isoform X4 [Ptychodera flava]
MERLVDEGTVKSIGVSNFNHKQVERILQIARYKPVANQVEVHPYFPRAKLIEWSKANDIIVIGYSPFGAPYRPWKTEKDPVCPLEHTMVKLLADKYQRTPAQILLRLSLDRGCAVIPKSQTPARMKENLEALDFQMTPDDIKVLEELDCNWKIAEFVWEKLQGHPHYPFNEEF